MRIRFAFVLAFLFAPALIAQTTDTASIRGNVSDAAGARVVAATVTLEDIGSGARRQTTSDDRGHYTFGAVPVSGTYRLRVAKTGFAEVTKGPFALRAGETATLDATLTAEAVSDFILTGSVPESIRPFGLERFRHAAALREREAQS